MLKDDSNAQNVWGILGTLCETPRLQISVVSSVSSDKDIQERSVRMVKCILQQDGSAEFPLPPRELDLSLVQHRPAGQTHLHMGTKLQDCPGITWAHHEMQSFTEHFDCISLT